MILPQDIHDLPYQIREQLTDRTVMLIDPCFDLLCSYIPALRASGWDVVGVATTPTDFFHLYRNMQVKPKLIIVEYNLLEKAIDSSPSNSIGLILEDILQQNPNQQIIFVTEERKLLLDLHFLPPSLQHIPVILKSTHTIEEMVLDLDELPFYYPPISN